MDEAPNMPPIGFWTQNKHFDSCHFLKIGHNRQRILLKHTMFHGLFYTTWIHHLQNKHYVVINETSDHISQESVY